MFLYILGREKELCLAELEAKLGDVKLISNEIATSSNQIEIDLLGGSIKVAKIINSDLRNMAELESEIIKDLNLIEYESKFSFGMSLYGKSKLKLAPMGIKIKRELQKQGKKPRLVLPKSDNTLNAASVKHNKLVSKGAEYLIVQTQNSMVLAKTLGVQDIDSYSKRDYDKPCRDRKVGMLPPKLSQIMINLANPSQSELIYDPFCGSGGLLMEASLMGYKSAGSDLSEEMVKCSTINTDWFVKEFQNSADIKIEQAEDATTKKYEFSNYSIVTEGFLGTNFLSKPTKELIKEQTPKLKQLYIDFFKNLNNQVAKPNSICICFPFWKFDNQVIELNLIDEIANLGYTITEFKSVRRSILSYHREGQFTGRQIVVFKPNKEK